MNNPATSDKRFREIHSITEALQTLMAAVKDRHFVNDTAEVHATATFMNATQWMLCELGQAAMEDKLLERLSKLMDEHELILRKLRESTSPAH